MKAGVVANQRGDYAGAAANFAAALREAESFGEADERFAIAMSNLAEQYRALGQYAAAEPLYKRSLAIREKALGPEHPDVAVSLSNLAALYTKLGKTEEAKQLSDRAAEIRALKR